MAQFKVKYKERAALARALSREIRSLGLVDTWTLVEGVRIAAEGSNVELNTINLRVVAPYYYLFQDRGADLWNGGKITAQDITRKWTESAQDITRKWTESAAFQKVIAEIVQQYIDWSIEEFPILEVAKFMDNPSVKIGFSFYGDESGKWNIDIAPGQ
jgi:hypothetical protein